MKEYYNPDVIMYHDDIGTQNNMFFSPELWRRMFKPQLKKAVDKAHELGFIFEYHSCGKIEQVVPDFVEIGIDAWQGQSINDICKLKTLTKGKLEYHPIFDYQNLIAKYYAGGISEEEIRAYTRSEFEKNIKGGHCVMLMSPFGDPVSMTMFDENIKLSMEYTKDPN